MPPSAAFFLAAYSWILFTKSACKVGCEQREIFIEGRLGHKVKKILTLSPKEGESNCIVMEREMVLDEINVDAVANKLGL